MADATTSSITIGADPEHVMAVIADFAAYPEWADQVKSVEILDTDGFQVVAEHRLDRQGR